MTDTLAHISARRGIRTRWVMPNDAQIISLPFRAVDRFRNPISSRSVDAVTISQRRSGRTRCDLVAISYEQLSPDPCFKIGAVTRHSGFCHTKFLRGFGKACVSCGRIKGKKRVQRREFSSHRSINLFYESMTFLCLVTLLHKSTDRQSSPFPRRTYPTGSVMGMPSAV